MVMKRGREWRDDGGEGPRLKLRMAAEWTDGGGRRRGRREGGNKAKGGTVRTEGRVGGHDETGLKRRRDG